MFTWTRCLVVRGIICSGGRGEPFFFNQFVVPDGLGKLLDDGQDGRFQVQLGSVRGIDMNTNTVQCTLNGLLGSTVQHFITNGSRIWIPGNKDQFGGGTAIVRGEFQINKAVTTIIFWQILAKIFIIFGSVARGFNHDSLLVDNLVDVVSEFVSRRLEFKPLKRRSNFRINNNTGRLYGIDEIERQFENHQIWV